MEKVLLVEMHKQHIFNKTITSARPAAVENKGQTILQVKQHLRLPIICTKFIDYIILQIMIKKALQCDIYTP